MATTSFEVKRIWFTAASFVIGSALFAIGVVLSLDEDLIEVAGWTFFAGSIFFTTAGLLQFLTSRADDPASHHHAHGLVAWLRQPRTRDWSASAIQLVGTVLFNANTFRAATLVDPTATQVDRLVWAPDALGSVAFLVSSGMAFAPEVRRRRHEHHRDRSWAIGALNLLGSVFFGLSAIGAWVLPETGALANVRWSNGGTFLGALCFLVAAALLLPRWPFSSKAGDADQAAIDRG